MTEMIRIPYVGGPDDGQNVYVELDENGQPPQYPTNIRLGEIDWSADPAAGPIGPVMSRLYALDTQLTTEGTHWVYRFVGETETDIRHAA